MPCLLLFCCKVESQNKYTSPEEASKMKDTKLVFPAQHNAHSYMRRSLRLETIKFSLFLEKMDAPESRIHMRSSLQ